MYEGICWSILEKIKGRVFLVHQTTKDIKLEEKTDRNSAYLAW